MASHPSQQKLDAQILEWAKAGQIDKLESSWIEQVGALPAQSAFYKEFLKSMKRAGALDRAEQLLTLAVEDRVGARKFKVAMRILLATLPAFPKSASLRPLLLEAMRGFYADVEMLPELLKLTGLDGSASMVEGFQAFQDWVRMTPGQVYQHYDWGEGVVQGLDLAASKVTLLFGGELEKTLTVEGVKKYLKYIEPGHFLAQRAKEPEALGKLAETDPAELVKLILQSQPNKQLKQAEMKTLITPSVIAAGQWNSWWGKAREALKLDPFIDFDTSGGAHAMISLRETPRTFEQEIEEQFFAADADTSLKAELIRQLAKRAKDSLPVDLARRMAARLGEDWRIAADKSPAARLEIAYMLADLAAALPEVEVKVPSDRPVLDEITDYAVLFEVDNVDYGIRAITRLLERDGEAGCRQAAALIPQAPVKLAQAIWGALEEEHHADLAVNALQKLFDNPLDNPETYAWAVRATLDGSWHHMEDFFPPSGLLLEVVEQMEDWQRLATEGGSRQKAEDAKTLLSRMRTLLGANKFAAIALGVEEMPREMIARLRHRIQANSALPSTFKAQAERIILLTRKDLEDVALQKAAAEAEIHYCTERAKAEKSMELRHLTSVRIPKNAKVIEEARQEGDLRENAGYQYAKEEQKMLVQAQATLTELLARCHVVYPQEVDPAAISFGTQIRVLNTKSGQEETYTILGRWEANPERHILSIQAPLAQQFTGHKVGDTVEIAHPGGGSTVYQVLEINNALASGEWDATRAQEPVEAE